MAVILPQSMQQDIQSSLPVIPNNGNPGGAYNIAAAPQEQQAPPNPLAWLEPSRYMGMVNTILEEQDFRLEELLQRELNPQQKQLYNWVPREGSLAWLPLNDHGLPFESDDTYYMMPRDDGGQPLTSAPILPGD